MTAGNKITEDTEKGQFFVNTLDSIIRMIKTYFRCLAYPLLMHVWAFLSLEMTCASVVSSSISFNSWNLKGQESSEKDEKRRVERGKKRKKNERRKERKKVR